MPWLPALNDGKPLPRWRTWLRTAGFWPLAVLVALIMAIGILFRIAGFLLAIPLWALRWLFHIPARQKDIVRWRNQWAKTKEGRETASLVLADPTLPPEQLTTIAERALSEDWTLPTADRRAAPLITAIAAHPNTPPATLVDLLNRRPHDAYPGFIQNPILPLLSLEFPDFVRELSGATIHYLLLQRDLPATAARLIATHPDLLTAFDARTHIALLPDDGDNISEDRAARGEEFNRLIRDAVQNAELHQRCCYGTMAILGLAPAWCIPVWCNRETNPLQAAELWERLPPVPNAVQEALRGDIGALEQGRLPDSVAAWCSEMWGKQSGVPINFDPLRRIAILRILLADQKTPSKVLAALLSPSHPLRPMTNTEWWGQVYLIVRHKNVPPRLLARCRRNTQQFLVSGGIARFLFLLHRPQVVFAIRAEDLGQYCDTGDLPTRLALARTLTRWHPLHIVLRRHLTRDPNALVRAARR